MLDATVYEQEPDNEPLTQAYDTFAAVQDDSDNEGKEERKDEEGNKKEPTEGGSQSPNLFPASMSEPDSD